MLFTFYDSSNVCLYHLFSKETYDSKWIRDSYLCTPTRVLHFVGRYTAFRNWSLLKITFDKNQHFSDTLMTYYLSSRCTIRWKNFQLRENGQLKEIFLSRSRSRISKFETRIIRILNSTFVLIVASNLFTYTFALWKINVSSKIILFR